MLQTARTGLQEPPETRGRTAIADGVVEKIAGIAAREVPGHRTMGAVHDRVPGGHASAGGGVRVEVGEKQAAIDLHVVVEYGVSSARSPRRSART